MEIGSRLREFREHKKLSQGNIETRTGLLRYYISRVENGHTIPSVETLEKFARAFEVPLYQLFCDGVSPKPSDEATANPLEWSELPKEKRFARKFRHLLGRISKRDRSLLLSFAQRMAGRNKR